MLHNSGILDIKSFLTVPDFWFYQCTDHDWRKQSYDCHSYHLWSNGDCYTLNAVGGPKASLSKGDFYTLTAIVFSVFSFPIFLLINGTQGKRKTISIIYFDALFSKHEVCKKESLNTGYISLYSYIISTNTGSKKSFSLSTPRHYKWLLLTQMY